MSAHVEDQIPATEPFAGVDFSRFSVRERVDLIGRIQATLRSEDIPDPAGVSEELVRREQLTREGKSKFLSLDEFDAELRKRFPCLS